MPNFEATIALLFVFFAIGVLIGMLLNKGFEANKRAAMLKELEKQHRRDTEPLKEIINKLLDINESTEQED